MNEFLNLEDNRKTLSILLFLGYQLQIEAFENNIEDIVCEPVHNLKRKEKNNKKILFKVITFFNTLDIKYNFNDNRSYNLFLKYYLGAIATLGYSKRMEYWMFEFPEPIHSSLEFVTNILEDFKIDLLKKKGQYKLPYIQAEFDQCILFVEKNLELMYCQSVAPSRGPSFSISKSRSSWIHQDEVDRILDSSSEMNSIINAAEMSYVEGKILLPEYDYILKKISDNHYQNAMLF